MEHVQAELRKQLGRAMTLEAARIAVAKQTAILKSFKTGFKRDLVKLIG